MLLQIIPSYVDKSAGPTVVCEFGNEGFSLLNEAFESCRGGLAETHCAIISSLSHYPHQSGTYLIWRC
jgi:hypothetical protein